MNPLNIPSTLAGTPTTPPKYPISVKDKNGKETQLADPNSSRALVALMDFYAVNGGAASHWGGPAAFAEIMSALHGIMFTKSDRPWFENYNFVNDAGHAENGIYAVRANYGFAGMELKDLLLFRSIESPLTGHGESHVNPEGVLLSNGPLSSSIAQAQGLAFADRLTKRKRTTILTVSDGALMEGEAKESLASIPGMAKKEKLNPFIMVISDNNTKLSGRISDDSFSMQPTFETLSGLGWKVISIEDGHDLQAVYLKLADAIEQAQNNPTAPIAVWAKTIKGKGVKSTEDSASGGHGFPLKQWDAKITDFIQEIYSGKAPEEFLEFAKLGLNKPEKSASNSAVKKEKIQVGVAKALIKARNEGLPVYSLSSDLAGSTGVKNFQSEHSDSFFDVGIAESNMVSIAAGCAKAGLIPVVDTFAQFGVTKGNLPLTMAALSSAPVISIFSHTGMQDAADGASHQATTYISAVSSIPNTQVICLSCSEEAEHYVYQAIKNYKEDREAGKSGQNMVFFLGRENFPNTLGQKNFEWNKAQVLEEGKAATIVSQGSLIHKALKANELLRQAGKEPMTVINHPFANIADVKVLKDALGKTENKLITLEDHQVKGGMGALITHELSQNDVSCRTRSLGIKNHFGRSAYTADQLYSAFEMDEHAVLKALDSL